MKNKILLFVIMSTCLFLLNGCGNNNSIIKQNNNIIEQNEITTSETEMINNVSETANEIETMLETEEIEIVEQTEENIIIEDNLQEETIITETEIIEEKTEETKETEICTEEITTETIEQETEIVEENIVSKIPKFIIDSDFSSDVDDPFAVSTAMYFQDMGLADVEGLALCCTSTRATYAASALLYQHKYYDIPVSLDNEWGIPIGNKYYMAMTNGYPYNDVYFSNTVKFYRKLLSESEDKINIVTLGQLVNISRLMESGPDEYSPLTGMELIQEKVNCLYILGCKANGVPENNMWYSGENLETNKWYKNGVQIASRNVSNNYPGKIVWMTSELGGLFNVGQFLNTSDRNANYILTKALKAQEYPNGCMAFDPMGIYIAFFNENNMLESKGMLLQQGTMRVYENGSSTFTDNELTRNHYRVIKTNPNSFYESEINQMLGYEYTKITGKKVIW